jgi:Galactose oxidase, central domain
MRSVLSSSWNQIKAKEKKILAETSFALELERKAKDRISKELLFIDQLLEDTLTQLKTYCKGLKNDIDKGFFILKQRIQNTCENYKQLLMEKYILDQLKLYPTKDLIDQVELSNYNLFLPNLNISKIIEESTVFDLNLIGFIGRSRSCLSLTSSSIPSSIPSETSLSPDAPYKRSRTRVSTKINKKSLPVSLYTCLNKNLVSYNINTEETYNIEANIDAFAVCTLRADGTILITGGKTDSYSYIFNIFEKTFEKTEKMTQPRFFHSGVSLGDFVYVIGGRFENVLKSCERFDSIQKTWQTIGDLVTPREKHSSCVYRGRIFVAGGENLSSLEVYNTVSNKFSILRPTLSVPGCALMFPVENFMIIFHDKTVSTFDPIKFTCDHYSCLDTNDWYTNSSVCVTNKQAYFIKNKVVYRYNIEQGSIFNVVNIG